MRPYSELRLKNNRILREFSWDVPSEELEWHMDRSDRRVKVIEGHGWKLQLEQGLPKEMLIGETYFIPRESWHRILKGQGSLMILISETSDNY
jgi:hypothetical protein